MALIPHKLSGCYYFSSICLFLNFFLRRDSQMTAPKSPPGGAIRSGSVPVPYPSLIPGKPFQVSGRSTNRRGRLHPSYQGSAQSWPLLPGSLDNCFFLGQHPCLVQLSRPLTPNLCCSYFKHHVVVVIKENAGSRRRSPSHSMSSMITSLFRMDTADYSVGPHCAGRCLCE